VGSNPTPSAKQEARTQMSAGFFYAQWAACCFACHDARRANSLIPLSNELLA
jgi:hypothetical protein